MDWREAFRKYMTIVGEGTGVLCLSEGDWTTEEWMAINTLVDECHAVDPTGAAYCFRDYQETKAAINSPDGY